MTDDAMVTLQTDNLSKNFLGLRALNNVSLQIKPSEIFGLIGPNGSGKTTFFNLITGFLKPSAGSVTYQGETITNLHPHEIAKTGIVRTFQIVSLFPTLTCKENVITGMHLKSKNNFWGSFAFSKAFQKQESKMGSKALELLRFFGIEHRMDAAANTLPLGDQRKLEIAIALACSPRVLLLDEPASGMSPSECNNIVELIRKIRDMGITIMVVEHNMSVVMELCNRIAVLNYGEKIAEGTPEEIINNERVVSCYLGEN
jgi:branched-chain amino acid transport system ATP-binding protein